MAACLCIVAFLPVVTISGGPVTAAPADGVHGRHVRVQVLIFNPTLPDQGNQRLNDYFGWRDPDDITAGLISTFASASDGEASYAVVDHEVIDEWPVLADGYAYDEQTWFACSSDHATCHKPDIVDYLRILSDHQSCDLRNRGDIDEVWLWGGPFFGYYESTLAGPGAFTLNSPALSGSSCEELLPIMGFNYERQLPEALESYGHRVDDTMKFVYGNGSDNPWHQFTDYDVRAPGRSGCGSVHIPPNGVVDYDFSNTSVVLSDCDDWPAWPSPPGNFVPVSCATWGCDETGYLTWWLSHVPRNNGRTDGIDNDWWHYILIDARVTRAAWNRLLA